MASGTDAEYEAQQLTSSIAVLNEIGGCEMSPADSFRNPSRIAIVTGLVDRRPHSDEVAHDRRLGNLATVAIMQSDRTGIQLSEKPTDQCNVSYVR